LTRIQRERQRERERERERKEVREEEEKLNGEASCFKVDRRCLIVFCTSKIITCEHVFLNLTF
jgi:hypothetical protein